jgi:hypothetical protein
MVTDGLMIALAGQIKNFLRFDPPTARAWLFLGDCPPASIAFPTAELFHD